MLKINYDLMNNEYYLTILGLRVSNQIASFLVKLGAVEENEDI
jgi:hypothetical protein